MDYNAEKASNTGSGCHGNREAKDSQGGKTSLIPFFQLSHPGHSAGEPLDRLSWIMSETTEMRAAEMSSTSVSPGRHAQEQQAALGSVAMACGLPPPRVLCLLRQAPGYQDGAGTRMGMQSGMRPVPQFFKVSPAILLLYLHNTRAHDLRCRRVGR